MTSAADGEIGEQEGTAYNRHFGCTCDHPLFCLNRLGDPGRTSCF